MNLHEIQKNLTTDAMLVFRNNHFLGQDILDTENQISALTGFDGSAGTLLITRKKAFLFVDGRYEIQSKQQTNPEDVTVIVESPAQNIFQWMRDYLPQLSIAFNPWQISISELQNFKNALPNAVFVPQPVLVSTGRAAAFNHDIQYAGKSAEEKIKDIAKQTAISGADAVFFAAADSVSWLTNLRSNALPETPILRAMALLNKEGKITLFTDNVRLPSDCRFEKKTLAKIKSTLKEYAGKKLNLDFKSTPAALVDICTKLNIKILNHIDSCAFAKAQKNEIELQGITDAHLHDGIAMCRFLSWFDKNHQGKTEMDIVHKLLSFRKKQPLFHSVSFGTIAGSAENAAIIHYQPNEKHFSKIKDNSVLLLDSGGQYLNGTTDITRTIAVGTPMDEIKQKFTVVLKAHIALASLRFPQHTSGVRLDAVCRSVMWRFGLDYKHGTGHGVGCFLNVHEGPQNIGASGNSYSIKSGMVVSIEPGYYQENAFGIRIENLVKVVEDKEISGFLKFEPLTLAPIDFRLVDKYLLDDGEIKWLNNYHHTVFKKLQDKLSKQDCKWLEKACAPL